MNSVVRAVAQRALHRREVRDRLQRPAAAAVGNKSKQAAAAYSTADRLAAYRYRSEGGYLLVPLVTVGAGIWLVTTALTRCFMRPPRQGTTTTTTKAAAVSPTN